MVFEDVGVGFLVSSGLVSELCVWSKSVFVKTTMMPLPASMIWPARDWSSLEWGSVASTRRAQMSDSSIAARVRRAENFSMPTSRLPGLRRPAVSRISRFLPWNLTLMRLTSRVVPWREETMACCFLPRELKRLLLPTLGRPIRAILSGLATLSTSVAGWSRQEVLEFSSAELSEKFRELSR